MSFLIVFLVLSYFFDLFIEYLNLSRLSFTLPTAFSGIYDEEKYRKSQEYIRTNTKFDLIEGAFGCSLLIVAVAAGWFNSLDIMLRSHVADESLRGLAFIGSIFLASQILSLPFNIYSTFVIEEKFGFNRTTIKTFIADLLKGWLIGILIGGPVLFGFLWIWNQLGESAWLWAWMFLVAVQMFVMFVAPVTIMPLFNKFKPLPDGQLKSEIESYAQSTKFKMQGIFTMDGSKRSTKANAFFTGFGRFRRIVLFDTLIEKHTQEELVAVLAHEVGHYQLKHIFRQLYLSLFITGLTLFLMSLFSTHPFVFEAFGMTNSSTYAGLVFFGIFYSPISTIISMYSLYLSRKYEFEADDYSRKTYGKPKALASALQKLSVENLSNLDPHPLKVITEYTHPPIMQRLARLSR